MPLYMDIHTVDSDSFSVEDVVKAHMQDLEVQDRFGVTQLKYWVNEDAKTLFCLMKGPDKEACNQVHLQSHGDTACNIIEVSDNEYNLFMGIGTEVNDLAHTEDGQLDTGYRTVLLANIITFSDGRKVLSKAINKIIKDNGGIVILVPGNELMVSFIYASDAINCAREMLSKIKDHKIRSEFSLAISSGRPVDESGDRMFEETKKKIHALCSFGLSNRSYLDENTLELARKELLNEEVDDAGFTVLSEEDVDMLLDLSKIINQNLLNNSFGSEELNKLLGLSKSKAYRRIKSLLDKAPNQIIQESRLFNCLQLLSKKDCTVSEAAYESGFNSPAYFTRVFKKRFRILPTDFAKID